MFKRLFGCALSGATYQMARRTVESSSVVKSAIYSALLGLFAWGARKCLK